MINISNISLSFGARTLLNDISFTIAPGDRIGLIGRNGAGKSSLLKIISGEYSPDKGNISKPNQSTIGILKQDILEKKGISIRQEVRSSFIKIKRLEEKLAEINVALETRTDYESEGYSKLIEDLNTYTDQFTNLGGYTLDEDMEKVLTGLGFKQNDFEKDVSTFSGGWKMRIELAKLLLQDHVLLLLDEPTNHLDMESIMWLENFLVQQNKTVILVSHDVEFLNRVCNRTIEVSLGRLYDHYGNYDKYQLWRVEVKEKQIQSKKNQDRKIAQTEQLINKFRAKANKASFAQSLIKQLDKVERIEVDEEDTRAMRFYFPSAPRAGEVVLKGQELSKNYGSLNVFENINLEIYRNEKIAFVGQNGQGKSTMVKMIAEGLGHKGQLDLGHNVVLGYYAQEQSEKIQGNESVLENVEAEAGDQNALHIRKLLGSFMFSGEEADKKVSVLSGGERARLALCKLLLKPINLLVMDEPTNHLDIISKNVLKEALKKYDGTLLLVSHDRDFLEGLAEKTYEFKDGNLKEYLGGIEYFLEKRELDSMRALELAKKEKSKNSKKTSDHQQNYQERKKSEKDERKRQNQIKKLESEIEKLETRIAEQEANLKDPIKFQELSSDSNFFSAYETDKKTLDTLLEEWEDLID